MLSPLPSQRANRRVPFQLDVEVKAPGERAASKARAVNLSASGAYIRSSRRYSVGTALLFRLPTPLGEREVQGRVVRQGEHGRGVGIQFESLGQPDVEALSAIVGGAGDTREVHVRFDGSSAPLKSLATVTQAGLRLFTTLPFLKAESPVEVSIPAGKSTVKAAGQLRDVRMEPRNGGGVPTLAVDVALRGPGFDEAVDTDVAVVAEGAPGSGKTARPTQSGLPPHRDEAAAQAAHDKTRAGGESRGATRGKSQGGKQVRATDDKDTEEALGTLAMTVPNRRQVQSQRARSFLALVLPAVVAFVAVWLLLDRWGLDDVGPQLGTLTAQTRALDGRLEAFEARTRAQQAELAATHESLRVVREDTQELRLTVERILREGVAASARRFKGGAARHTQGERLQRELAVDSGREARWSQPAPPPLAPDAPGPEIIATASGPALTVAVQGSSADASHYALAGKRGGLVIRFPHAQSTLEPGPYWLRRQGVRLVHLRQDDAGLEIRVIFTLPVPVPRFAFEPTSGGGRLRIWLPVAGERSGDLTQPRSESRI